MTNWTKDLSFQLALARLGGAIAASAKLGLSDARAIRWRAAGGANLQGHVNALVPLALLLAKQDPSLVRRVRRTTSLANDMGKGSSEARDASLRTDIAAALSTLQASQGADVVAHEIRNGKAITVGQACSTYLSSSLGGSQRSGGAGDTVIKRSLKLIAHFGIL